MLDRDQPPVIGWSESESSSSTRVGADRELAQGVGSPPPTTLANFRGGVESAMRTQRTFLLSSAALALGVVAVFGMASVGIAGGEEAQADGAGEQLSPPQLQVDSDPMAILYYEFSNSGWGHQDATALTLRAVKWLEGKKKIEPFEPQEPAAEGSIRLHPDSDPLAVFYWAFRHSGHSADVAANYTVRMQRRLLEIEPEDPALDMNFSGCHVYPAHLVFCSDGTRQSKRTWINAPCWETKQWECPEFFAPVCPLGQSGWYTVHFDDCDNLPCSWLSVGEMATVPCSHSTIDCDCIEEADCADFESVECCCTRQACSDPGTPSTEDA